MTGPAYPPGPQPGSNAIGSFVIGVSPIGDIRPFDALKSIISQYANSPRIDALISNFQDYIDQTENIQSFYDLVFNVQTAQGHGLDVWARIVGLDSRAIPVPDGNPFSFGFAEAGADARPFGQGTFVIQQPSTDNFYLSDTFFRLLILAKAYGNITDGSVKSINQIMMLLFPFRGNAYVKEVPPVNYLPGVSAFGFLEGDGEPFGQAPFVYAGPAPGMKMVYVFEFPLSPVEYALVASGVALPRPVGVEATIEQIY